MRQGSDVPGAGMSTGPLGFFLGAAPGVTYALWNMWQLRRLWKEAEKIARQHGEYLDYYSADNMNFNILAGAQKFIRPTDGPGVRAGKEFILARMSPYLARHAIALGMILLGAPVGLAVVAGIEYLWPAIHAL